jgi:hypothetical protein
VAFREPWRAASVSKPLCISFSNICCVTDIVDVWHGLEIAGCVSDACHWCGKEAAATRDPGWLCLVAERAHDSCLACVDQIGLHVSKQDGKDFV